MVVKPLDFIVRGRKGLVQPAVKCRGREYLRIIYGPDYTADEHLTPAAEIGAFGGKRSLALREFALGIEGLGTIRSARNRCGEFTSASSACWHWKASRSIRGCEMSMPEDVKISLSQLPPSIRLRSDRSSKSWWCDSLTCHAN